MHSIRLVVPFLACTIHQTASQDSLHTSRPLVDSKQSLSTRSVKALSDFLLSFDAQAGWQVPAFGLHSGIRDPMSALHFMNRILHIPGDHTDISMQADAVELDRAAAVDDCPKVDEAGNCIVDGKSSEAPAQTQKNVFGEMSAIARQLGADGVDLGQGFPDFDPPQFVVEALRQELEGSTEGQVRTTHQYTRTAGFPPLVEALAARYSQHVGRPVDPMTEVTITTGCTGALFLSLQTALDLAAPGCDEVVVLAPFFELYRAQTIGLKGKLRTVPLVFEEGTKSFVLDVEALSQALGPQTAALIVNTPNNPAGKAFEEGELRAIADLVQAHPHIVVISDEVYKYMIFDPPARSDQQVAAEEAKVSMAIGHVHFAGLPGMWDRTITVSSAGKTFGITGWQVGWAVGPKKWLAPMQRYIPNLQFCAPTLMQRALTKVLKLADAPYREHASYYDWLREDYLKRRARMVSALDAAGIPSAKAQGGFFLLADIRDLCGANGPFGDVWEEVSQEDEATDWTFCRAMAQKLGIVALPISPFMGPEASDDVRTRFVRFCFAKTDSTLDAAAERLKLLK